MSLLKRATESSQSEWAPTPEGLWRWVLDKPELNLSPLFGSWQVKFPLQLTPAEQERLKADYEAPPPGVLQSWRTSYITGLSLGYMKDGAYVSTKLIDFLAACLGSANIKNFRNWVSKGGGPQRPEDKDDDKAEMELIRSWLGWWEGLEVYGSIRHEPDKKNPNQLWGRFGGPIPVGSLPGQPDPDYQAHARGKLRAMLIEAGVELPPDKRVPVAAAVVAAPPAQLFTPEGKEVAADDDDIPF
jgi:hypothetical protein